METLKDDFTLTLLRKFRQIYDPNKFYSLQAFYDFPSVIITTSPHTKWQKEQFKGIIVKLFKQFYNRLYNYTSYFNYTVDFWLHAVFIYLLIGEADTKKKTNKIICVKDK